MLYKHATKSTILKVALEEGNSKKEKNNFHFSVGPPGNTNTKHTVLSAPASQSNKKKSQARLSRCFSMEGKGQVEG